MNTDNNGGSIGSGSRIKIVVLDGYTLNPGDISWDPLKEIGDLAVYNTTEPGQIEARAGDAEIILTNKTLLTKETLRLLKRASYIGVLATGYNVVDTAAARESGMAVTNIPAYGTSSVAQMTFALLLEMCHHVWMHSEAVKDGQWTKSGYFCFWNYPLIELAGKTMGIIGYGRIGRTVGSLAQCFGMDVLAFDEFRDSSLESETMKYSDLGHLLKNSDIISLHCPLTDSTKGIINSNTISSMKDGVMIINTARGPLIVEEDLRAALDGGKVAYAAVDVLSKEPPDMDNPLIGAKNCIITPHISWAPKESRQRLMQIAADNLRKYLAGTPVNVVN